MKLSKVKENLKVIVDSTIANLKTAIKNIKIDCLTRRNNDFYHQLNSAVSKSVDDARSNKTCKNFEVIVKYNTDTRTITIRNNITDFEPIIQYTGSDYVSLAREKFPEAYLDVFFGNLSSQPAELALVRSNILTLLKIIVALLTDEDEDIVLINTATAPFTFILKIPQ